MTPQQEHTVAATLDRAREIIEQHLPSWEGGFAVQVVECVEALKAELAAVLQDHEALSTRLQDMSNDYYAAREREEKLKAGGNPLAWVDELSIKMLQQSGMCMVNAREDKANCIPLYAAAKVPEARNIIEVKRTGDQTVSVSFASCRTASVFEKFILSAREWEKQ